MNDERRSGGLITQIWGHVRSALRGGATVNAPTSERVVSATPSQPVPTVQELINEGLWHRQALGALAAQPFFDRAAVIDPGSPVAFFMLGNLASELGDLDTAVRHYARARDLNPNDHVFRYNLGLNLLWCGYIEAAIDELRTACALNPEYLRAHSALIIALHNSDKVTPEQIAAVTRNWAATTFGAQQAANVQTGSLAATDLPEVLRVGFVSGDFRTHSVAHFFEPISTARNRDEFEHFYYSTAPVLDGVSQRLRANADHWRDASQMNDKELVDQIRADQLHILVDLAGHSEFNRLAVFASRAAPVQVSYLGYPDSTGLSTMDYRITDADTDPRPDADTWHTERLLRFQGPQWCFRPFGSLAAPGPLPARTSGFVTFGSFNNLSKVSDTTLHCWAKILAALPDSRLRLTRVRSPQRAREMVALFARFGIAAARIDCVPYRSDAPHGPQYAGVDIALDPYPYNGVTTTCESLYFGLPVISLSGRNGVSRSGLSLLRAVGLPELIAASPEQYIEIASALARDLERLERLRASLRLRVENSPLRDERRFAANFEELLRAAWRRA